MDLYIPPNLPGLDPPPGQTSNFDNPPRSLQQLAYALIIINLATSTLTTAARTYTRFLVSRNPGWDDYCMLGSWVTGIAMYAVEVKAVEYGAGVHQWDVRLVDVLEFAYWGYLTMVLYPIVMAFLKLSICFQILRIFITRRDRHFWIISVFTIIQFCWFFAVFWASLFQCKPIQKEFNPLYSGSCLVRIDTLGVCVGVFNVVSDIFIWTYPLVCVAQLNLSARRKLGAAFVFLFGFVATAVAIIRLYFSVQWLQNPTDATFTMAQLGFCTSGEVVAGIIAANSVCLPRFFIHVREKLSSFRSSTMDRTSLIRLRNSFGPEDRSCCNQEILLRQKTEQTSSESPRMQKVIVASIDMPYYGDEA